MRVRGVPLVVVTAMAAAALAGARSAPMRQVPVSAPVRLPAAAVTPVTVCPGPETLLAPAGSQPVVPTGTTVVAAALAEAPAGGRIAPLAPSSSTDRTGAADLPATTDGPSLVTVTRTGAGAVRLDARRVTGGSAGTVPGAAAVASAAQLTWGRSGALRGLAATTCGTPVDDAWLVGSGTEDGRRARLLLANSGAAPSVVDLTVLGPDGAHQPAAGQGLVIPAHGEIAVFVDALAPQLGSTAVHVQARTGRFVAVLQDSLMRGITPGGVDDLTAVAPARHLLLTGLERRAPGTVAVTVAVPGDRDAVVRVRLLGTEAGVDLPDGVVTVAAHSVKDVVLPGGVGDGTWTAALSSDVEVVASAMSWVTRAGGENAGTAAGLGKQVPVSELAWAAAGTPLTGDVLLALPALPPAASGAPPPVHARLVLARDDDPDPSLGASDTPAVVAVTLLAADGSRTTRSLAVTAGRTATLAVPDGTAAIRLAAGVAGPLLVGAVQLSATDAAGPLLAVLPLRSGPGAVAPAPAVVPDPRLG